VLKQYRRRVLLADEVGLGKTVEAGMILKEYHAARHGRAVLILTPASLVGQWPRRDGGEIRHRLRHHARSVAAQRSRRVLGAAAGDRLDHGGGAKEQAETLSGLHYDVVVVDEAHHLRDQSSASYQLVNRLQKRFVLLLSATPVQNSLLELYNLLTLLQPGIFKTQKEFRSAYMVPGKPRNR